MTRRVLGYRPRRAGFAIAGLIALLLTLTLSTNVRTQAGQAPAAPSQGPPAPAPTPEGGGFIAAGRGNLTTAASDYSPKAPYTARSAEEEAKGFILPVGYRMELVASDPDVISPAVIEFDGNGRMYVSELISYMMDAGASREHDPISRITRWESTKGDGRYDKRTVFVDKVVAPRMILPLAGRRDPHQRDRFRRPGEVDRHQRRRRGGQARDGLHRRRPERRPQPRASEGGPALGHGQLDLHAPTTRSASGGLRPASFASRPVPTAASGDSRQTTTGSRGSWTPGASAAR